MLSVIMLSVVMLSVVIKAEEVTYGFAASSKLERFPILIMS
jgi:hypothetical protein